MDSDELTGAANPAHPGLSQIRIAADDQNSVIAEAYRDAVETRFQAARWTLEASGHGLSAVAASIQLGMKKSGKKDLAELSVSELEEFIKRGKETFDGLKSATIHDVKVIDPPGDQE